MEGQSQNLRTFDPSKTASTRPKKSKQKLATEYYVAQEYQKAAALFEELYEENSSGYFYRYLLFCYVQLEEYRKAERMIKKAAKTSHKDYKEQSDLGYIQLQKGKDKKANSMFENAIDKLPKNTAAVKELASDFRSRGQTEWAKATYLKGRELLKGEYEFENELAYLYYYDGKYNEMTNEYLNLLERHPEQMRVVEYRLQSAFRRSSEDNIYPYIKKQLLIRIKKNPEQTQFSELLLWMSIQRKDFRMALIQAKSLDRRGGVEAYRVFDLSSIMLSHGDYEGCIEALEYVVKQASAREQAYYGDAKQALLSARYKLLQQQTQIDNRAITLLKKEFDESLKELGRNRYTISMVMDYAEFQSLYLNMPEKAIENLEELIGNNSIPKAEKAPAKILLGDLYLLEDNPWDATLLYSQVQMDFKDDEIGFEARLKNARLSFYIGEFDWAKAQLDILKVATNKKIANDAMKLSLFIAENLDADSSTRALELYGRAELLHLRKKDSLAMQTFDSIFMLSLYHEVFDDVYFREAEILAQSHYYEQSMVLLNKIVDEYPAGLLADDALWMMAEIEQNKLGDSQKASDYYKRILIDYPASLHTTEARERYRALRGDAEN